MIANKCYDRGVMMAATTRTPIACEACFPMHHARLIVCEGEERLVPIMRSRLQHGGLSWNGFAEPIEALRVCRTLGDCERQLTSWPESLAVIVIDKHRVAGQMHRVAGQMRRVAGQMRWLASLSQRWPRAKAAAVLRHDAPQLELALREAGACLVAGWSYDLQPLLRLAEAHFASLSEHDESHLKRLRKELPWGREPNELNRSS